MAQIAGLRLGGLELAQTCVGQAMAVSARALRRSSRNSCKALAAISKERRRAVGSWIIPLMISSSGW